MSRTILHLDLDAFFCAVEEQHQPALKGKPFAVGGRPDQRGVVASCSYTARRFRIHSAMPMTQARRLGPELIVVPQRHKIYSAVSKQLMERLLVLTPLVEQISIDEAFLDVSELDRPGLSIARELQKAILEELGLPCSIGVAANKLVAKIATNVAKAAHRADSPPNAIQVVPPGQEAAFLAPLPTEALWGIGPKTAARLAEMGVHSIGDLAAVPERQLIQAFGVAGQHMTARARGIDDRPIVTSRVAKSFSRETTFARDVWDQDTLLETLRELSASVSQRLQHTRLHGATVRLKIRWSDFTTLTRQLTLKRPTEREDVIFTAASRLLREVWPAGRPVRLIGVGISGLRRPIRQLTLWDAMDRASTAAASPELDERAERLRTAVAALRERFGDDIVRRGASNSEDQLP